MTVRLRSHRLFEKAFWLISTVGVEIVSTQSDVYKHAYSSKVPTYLGLRLPILALVESVSASEASIAKDKLGVVARRMAKYLQSDSNNRQRIKVHADDSSSSAAVMSQWNNMFAEFIGTQSMISKENSHS